jgi:hypothetical protein
MEELNEEQLKRLYFDYVEYRGSLSYLSKPVTVREFFEADKNRYT